MTDQTEREARYADAMHQAHWDVRDAGVHKLGSYNAATEMGRVAMAVADAELADLRAKLRAPERHLSSLLETIDSECDTTGPICHEHDLTDSGECALAADLVLILNEVRAVLEGGR